MSAGTVETVAARFPNDVAAHELTVLHDGGLYRHLRFAQPGTTNLSFSIVTWPGRLCFCGDMGTFVFQRIEDMLEFFRHDAPNLGYWAEKCVAQDREGVREYDAELLLAKARELADAATDELDEAARAEFLDELLDQLGAAESEQDARQRLAEFESHGISFSDTWELSFEQFTYRFAWCCHALVWAIKVYDAKRAAVPA